MTQVLLFSDGVFEIERQNGDMWGLDDLVNFLCTAPPDAPLMDHLLHHVQALQGSDQLADDFSIMEIDWLGRRAEDYNP